MSEANQRWLIVHADDLGLARAFNEGVREAYTKGILTSTSLRTNGSAFEQAVERVLPECTGMGVGLHLNIVEGMSQRKNIGGTSRICDSQGNYAASFRSLLQAYLSRDKSTFDEIEDDFRSQIEFAFDHGITPDHLSSHQHSHAIPPIFSTVCKLAAEYKIPFVRLPRERFYFGGGIGVHMAAWYPINLFKHFLLNAFSEKNLRLAKHHDVQTNDHFVGVLYTGKMTNSTLKNGLAPLSSLRSGIAEVLLHPCVVIPGHDER